MSAAEKRSSFPGSVHPTRSSSSPRPTTPQPLNPDPDNAGAFLQPSQGRDHTITHVRYISSRRYPPDCPPLTTRWFYAVDIPKKNSSFWGTDSMDSPDSKPLGPPKKFVPFSSHDSQRIETAFQTLTEQEETATSKVVNSTDEPSTSSVKVPVNEDELFDVDVQQRELAPAYWLGPIYEVRRGSWFFQDGSTLRPCEENLAAQLEEGYLKIKPWLLRHSKTASDSTSTTGPAFTKRKGGSSSPKEKQAAADAKRQVEGQTRRLFGAYMNSTVTYQDSSTAMLINEDFVSRMSSTVYQSLGGAAGRKLIRGYSHSAKPKLTTSTTDSGRTSFEGSEPSRKVRGTNEDPTSRSGRIDLPITDDITRRRVDSMEEPRMSPLQRQLSSLTGELQNEEDIQEEARKQEQQEMEDSREADGQDGEREIDHLILVTHGIGQRLGLRLDSINFVHDVNTLRKTLKGVYALSPDLQALNSDLSADLKNCRIQVLPVCWRHRLNFPRQSLKQNRKEFDLGDANNLSMEDEQYPSLSDITLEGVPAVRNLITDLAMDVLLYQSAYRAHIAGIVQKECNRIYQLFKARNPNFRGSVSLCGHSLGSAILFDILCQQPETPMDSRPTQSARTDQHYVPDHSEMLPLDFECDNLFCLGSPIALFQMLKGKTIAGRVSTDSWHQPLNGDDAKLSADPMSSLKYAARREAAAPSPSVSVPKCNQLYNIFHPSDPISYRIEPLISPAMTSLKPQPLPVVKRTIWSTSGQSLTNISTRVGQSVGSLWSNFASGVASSLLNRSLGLNEGPTSRPPSAHAHRKQEMAEGSLSLDTTDPESVKVPSLIDPQLETLYDGFEKTRKAQLPEDSFEGNENAAKLKLEESKVRALNSNGRVDYSIQEGVFDISLIASIASHLSYWGDEDVGHFVMSQIHSRAPRRKTRDS
ncbi:hypothetical protein AJ80_03028 [Polytolypa hystricis UAMH7299]|uniref:DDHD domain-containing protein n=1 Tax=Polytolypa hystricis (strain UAMH7299) TaxID=1447883 RepID=A0A2B7YJU6_POLH7|nr:hypothetical protein AJ80_03028 [Polytolypa hystricis UAMH7299]